MPGRRKGRAENRRERREREKKTDCVKKERLRVVGLRGLKIDTGIEGDLGTRTRA